MATAPASLLVRWAWVPLLGLILVLLALLREARHEAGVLRAAVEALETQAASLEKRVVAKPVPPASAPTPPAPSAAKPANRQALASWSDRNAMGEPEYAAVIARRERRYGMANSRAAIDALHLSTADQERLKQLITAQWVTEADAGDVMDRMGNVSPELREKAHAAAKAEAEAGMKSLLGEPGYANYQRLYEQTTGQRMNWALVTAFWDAGLPLSDAQQQAIAEAQQQVRSQFPRGRAQTADPETGLNEADLALLQAAGAFLSPEQQAFMRAEKIADRRYAMAANALAQRKRTATKAGP